MANYRVLVHYDPERSVFVARAPELEHCSGEGATRGEALTRVEEEIDAQLRNIREHGATPPPAVDEGADEGGEIALRISRSLRRELAYQARLEGVELAHLAGEMLATALEWRRGRGRRPASPQALGEGGDAARRDDRGTRDDRRSYRRDDRGQGGRYHAIMEDRATFLEYVRGLESGGGPPRGQGGGGRRRGRGRSGGGEGGSGSDGPGGDSQK